ncbi:MAG: LuxR C-terminal-related transcriptional regulator [Trebonia sp.]
MSTSSTSSSRAAIRSLVSAATVRKHLDNIFRRLAVTNRAAAVTRAFPGGPAAARIRGST